MNMTTIIYKNDGDERNSGSRQLEQQFGESKFLWLIVLIFYV